MSTIASLLLIYSSVISNTRFQCGQKETITRSYGKIELRVNCDGAEEYNSISVADYKDDVQHGFQIDFNRNWQKKDSSFFKNGKEEGTALYWDTLGNIIGKENYLHGKYIGKRESYFSPGHPAIIKNYNKEGKEDGPWFEWWKNGNKKGEFIAKNGEIISGTEYYQDGKPRINYRDKYDPKNRNVFKTKRIEGEAWAPNGNSTGKIERGNGEWIKFPDGKNPENKSVFHEVYKDSLMIKGEKLDSAQMVKWLNP
jgi:antitoxin component YwqK of YwqJK toxin-antitoxin module